MHGPISPSADERLRGFRVNPVPMHFAARVLANLESLFFISESTLTYRRPHELTSCFRLRSPPQRSRKMESPRRPRSELSVCHVAAAWSSISGPKVVVSLKVAGLRPTRRADFVVVGQLGGILRNIFPCKHRHGNFEDLVFECCSLNSRVLIEI